VIAVLPDSQEALAAFAAEHGITYPLLSDAGSAVIREYGILNTLIRPDEAIYGIPYPGLYITDEQGVVAEKIFHRRYQVRDDVESLLHTRFGAALHVSEDPIATAESPGVRVSAVLGGTEFVFQRRATLFVRVDLDAGLHVYGPPVPEGYVGTEVTVAGPEGLIVEPAAYPPTHPVHFEALNETLHVFEGEVEVAVPLTANIREGDHVPLEITVQYQACDDRQCFLPQRKTLRLDVPLAPLNRPPRRG
jgi:hypothetical protein